LRQFLLLAFCLIAMPAAAASADTRIFQFSYEIAAQDFPLGEAVDIYIPMPAQYTVGQKILMESLQSSVPGEVGLETANGSTYYRLHRPAGSTIPLSATLSWTVARDPVSATPDSLSAAQQARYLAADALVPVGHEILQPILAEIHEMRNDDSPAATARAIYDWVVDNVEYKKVGTGWGNGDTFWACNERYGNCTDFHSLFIALARSEGIPARFEMGFPIPADRKAGEIGGYHCWVQFYLPERGWVPIDASEAAKNPALRDALFGGHPADRIHFSTGRDLVLSAASAEAPLNYFIYPYVEIGGKPWPGKVTPRFSFTEVTST
jgi:transglutaminase-like putative cysteine protease